jgi:hypothetical protein
MYRIAPGLIVLIVCSLTGCNRFEPSEYAPLDPPAQYRAWWDSTEACSGLQGNFDRVHWFVVPGEDFECPTGRCSGRWEEPHTVYLAEGWMAHEMVVRHEMLHDLIGHPGHPDPPFGRGCQLTWSTWQGLRSDSAGGVNPD